MSFQSEYKITAADRQDKGVTGLPDTPNMPTTVIQERFDSLGNLAIDKFNALVDGASDSVDGSDTKFPTNKAIVDYISGEGGAIIDDNTPSTHKAYSSSKVENMYAAIPGNLINDTTPSSSTVYSGNKVENMFANVSDRIIDDSTPSSSKTYSSEEIEQKIADIPTPESFIDDDNVSTDTTFSSRKISDNYIGFAETEEQTATDEFSTINGGLLSECKVTLEPIQDLHGYDHPWVGGAGKNKLEVTVTTQTINGVTFTVNTDGSILMNGTATADIRFQLRPNNLLSLNAERYIVNGTPAMGGASTYRLAIYNQTTHGYSAFDNGAGSEFVLSGTSELSVFIDVINGVTADNITFKPMIRLSTETDPTFEPYSNICPISGHTQVEVDVSDGQTTQEQVTVNLGGTYYSGTLDVVSGVFVADEKTVDLGSLNWVADDFYKTSSLASEIKIPTVQNPYVGLISSILQENSVSNIYNGEDGIGVRYSTVSGEIRLRYTGMPTVLSDFVASVTGQTLCYPLATPIPIQLIPTPVKANVGENHLSAPLDGQEITESKYRYLFTWDIVEDELNKLSDSIEEVSDDLSDRIDDVEETLDKTHYSSAVSCAIDDTTCTIADANITTSSLIEPFYSNTSGDNVVIKNQTVTTGQVVLTFDALLEATSFSVRITNL